MKAHFWIWSLALFFVSPLPLQAQTGYRFDLVVLSGDPVPGIALAQFDAMFSSAAINNSGEVVFCAVTLGGIQGAWRGNPGSLSRVVSQGQNVVLSGAPQSVTGVDSARIDDTGGVQCFLATSTSSQIIARFPQGGAAELHFAQSGPAPGPGGTTFSGLGNRHGLSSAGSSAVSGLLFGNDTTNSVVCVASPSSPPALELVARRGTTPVAGGPSGPPPPGAAYGSFFPPSSAGSGRLAVAATLDNGSSGIWIGGPGDLTLVALSGQVAPGTINGTYSGFSLNNSAIATPRTNSNLLAFNSGITGGGGGSGIWAGTPGNLRLVARSVQQAPGLAPGISIGGPGTPSMTPDGRVAFVSQVDASPPLPVGERRSLFAEGPDGVLRLVIRRGTAITAGGVPRLVSDFTMGASGHSFNAAGQIVFVANFSDGSQGVLRATPLYAAPVVRVNGKKRRSVPPRPRFNLRGTALSDAGINRVQVRARGSKPRNARLSGNGRNWQAKVRFPGKDNVIQTRTVVRVFAFSNDGQRSLPARVVVNQRQR